MYSPSSYTGDGATATFTVGFAYLRKSHVSATVDGSPATFTWASDTQITFDSVPAVDDPIEIIRTTPTSSLLIDFTNDSAITEQDIEDSFKQTLYALEEALLDFIVGGGMLKSAGNWDAENVRITNLASATGDNDAVRKIDVFSYLIAAQVAQAAAETAQTNAETAESNAETAEANAEAAQAAAEAAVAIFPTISGGDAGKAVRVNSGETAYEYGFPKPDFTYTDTSLVADSGGSAAHGFGAYPELVVAYMECTSNNQGYTTGQRVPLSAFTDGLNDGIGFYYDATNVGYIIGDNVTVTHRTSGSIVPITKANWKVVIKAWA